MMWHTHLAISLLISSILTPIINPSSYTLFILIIIITSLLPDIDHKGSKINNIIPITKITSKIFDHRGFFHSIYPPLILYLIFTYTGLPNIALATLIGYTSHLISDSITRKGLNLLHPFSTLKIRGFIPVGGITELIIFITILVLSILKTGKEIGLY